MSDNERAEYLRNAIRGERVISVPAWDIHCLLCERDELLSEVARLRRLLARQPNLVPRTWVVDV